MAFKTMLIAFPTMMLIIVMLILSPTRAIMREPGREIVGLNQWLSQYDDCTIAVAIINPEIIITEPVPVPILLGDGRKPHSPVVVGVRRHLNCSVLFILMYEFVQSDDSFRHYGAINIFSTHNFVFHNEQSIKLWNFQDMVIFLGLNETRMPELHQRFGPLNGFRQVPYFYTGLFNAYLSYVYTGTFFVHGRIDSSSFETKALPRIKLTQLTYLNTRWNLNGSEVIGPFVPLQCSLLRGYDCRDKMCEAVETYQNPSLVRNVKFSYDFIPHSYIVPDGIPSVEIQLRPTLQLFHKLKASGISRAIDPTTIIFGILIQADLPSFLDNTFDRKGSNIYFSTSYFRSIRFGEVDTVFMPGESTSPHLTQVEGFNFVTCDGVQSHADFWIYFTPFDFWSWFWLFLSISILSMLLTALKRVQLAGGVHHRILSDFIDAILYGISAFFGNNTKDVTTRKSSNRTCFSIDVLKIAFVSLSLLWLILGNGYLGLITSNVIAPFQTTSKWQKIQQLEVLFVPFAAVGTFYPIAPRGGRNAQHIYPLSAIARSQRLPVRVKMVFGFIPTNVPDFTGTLEIESADTEDVILACTILREKPMLFELDVDSGLLLSHMTSEDLFIKSTSYQSALNYCRSEGDLWKRQIRISQTRKGTLSASSALRNKMNKSLRLKPKPPGGIGGQGGPSKLSLLFRPSAMTSNSLTSFGSGGSGNGGSWSKDPLRRSKSFNVEMQSVSLSLTQDEEDGRDTLLTSRQGPLGGDDPKKLSNIFNFMSGKSNSNNKGSPSPSAKNKNNHFTFNASNKQQQIPDVLTRGNHNNSHSHNGKALEPTKSNNKDVPYGRVLDDLTEEENIYAEITDHGFGLQHLSLSPTVRLQGMLNFQLPHHQEGIVVGGAGSNMSSLLKGGGGSDGTFSGTLSGTFSSSNPSSREEDIYDNVF